MCYLNLSEAVELLSKKDPGLLSAACAYTLRTEESEKVLWDVLTSRIQKYPRWNKEAWETLWMDVQHRMPIRFVARVAEFTIEKSE